MFRVGLCILWLLFLLHTSSNLLISFKWREYALFLNQLDFIVDNVYNLKIINTPVVHMYASIDLERKVGLGISRESAKVSPINRRHMKQR